MEANFLGCTDLPEGKDLKESFALYRLLDVLNKPSAFAAAHTASLSCQVDKSKMTLDFAGLTLPEDAGAHASHSHSYS